MTKRDLALFLTGFLYGADLDPLVGDGLVKWVSRRTKKLLGKSPDDLDDIFWGAIVRIRNECDDEDCKFQRECKRVSGPTVVADLPGEVVDDGLKPEQRLILSRLMADIPLRKQGKGKRKKKKKRKK